MTDYWGQGSGNCIISGSSQKPRVGAIYEKGHPMGGLLIYGPPQRIRTSDLRLRRATLYPAELGADWVTIAV